LIMSALRFVPYKRNLKRRAQALRRDPSPAERKLWYEFLRSHPRKFTRQKPLGRYIADFYCSQLALVVEVDGDSHFSERARGRDSARSAAIAAYGIRVMRFTNREVGAV
jgi:very-short-patch-repair endonuclease